jgi:Ca2+-binding RTX toxin-like protein
MAIFDGDGGDNDIRGTDQADIINGKGGNDRLDGARGDDRVRGGQGDDRVAGSLGDDHLIGDAGDDTLSGGELDLPGPGDDDTLDGGAGNDLLLGGAGRDRMLGGTGDDKMVGGRGLEVDIMTGGAGADVYEYRGKIAFFPDYETGVGAGNRDKITDFDAAEDKLDFTLSPLVDEFVGDGPVGEGEVGFFETATRTIIVGNDDADAAPEFEIELAGTDLGLTAENFIF